MASKKKKLQRKKRSKPASKLVSKPVKNTARRKIDPQTGLEISRRQYDKKYKPAKKSDRALGVYKHKYRLYLGLRNDYMDNINQERAAKGLKKLSKREAMQSPKLKKIIKDLHSSNPIVKAKALAKTGRIKPDQIELYAQKFADED